MIWSPTCETRDLRNARSEISADPVPHQDRKILLVSDRSVFVRGFLSPSIENLFLINLVKIRNSEKMIFWVNYRYFQIQAALNLFILLCQIDEITTKRTIFIFFIKNVLFYSKTLEKIGLILFNLFNSHKQYQIGINFWSEISGP